MFLLGSFTDGMFKGAQSAMSMYTGIQGILAAQDSAAMSKKVEEQRQKELSDQKGMTQADTAIGELQASRAPPAAPAPTVPGGDKPLGTTPASTTTPAPKPETPVAAPSGITSAGGDAAERARDAAKAMEAARIAQAAAPRTADQMYGNAGSLPVTPTSQLYGNAGALPVTPTTQLYGGVPNAPAQAPMTSEAPAGIPPARTPGLTAPPVYQPATYSPFAGSSAPPAPASVTQPVGGYFTGQNPPGTVPATSGSPPVIPPAQAPAPPPPNTGARPVPQAAISPAPTSGGVGARFSGMLSSVGQAVMPSAHAEPAAGDVNAPQPGAAPSGAMGGGGSMGAPAPASGSPIADATIQDAPMPGQPGGPPPDTRYMPSTQRVTEVPPPAVPAKPDPSGKVTPGPVQVKTAEGQTVTQSETPTISMAPPVSNWYGQELERVDPGLARLAHQLVDQLGANAVTYDQVAAHMYRESRFKSGVTGPFGEHGVMQVMPDTQAWLERNILHRHVDASTPEGGMTLGITYLRYLANDLHLGGNTLQTNLAYMRGPGAVKQINQIGLEASQRGEGKYNLKNALGWLDDMYRTGGPGTDSAIKLDKNQFQGGALSENHVQVTPQGAMQAAANGPDGTLNYIASTGSPGLGMSELWIQYQGALERQAIWTGHLDMLPHIADFVLQQSHQGALANLAAADAALASGNMQGAASALARAHAFFPDGSYAQFGVTPDGKSIGGQQFSENTHAALGRPVMITREMIQQQMMALGNPHDYVKTLDAHRKINSDIDYQKAHGDYFRSLPGIKEAQEEGRNQRAADAAAAKEHEAELKRQAAIDKRETEEKNTNELDKELSGKYDINSKPPEVSSQDWANRSEIERQIRLPNSMGGAHLGGATGAAIAEGMTSGAPGTPPAIRIVPAYADKEKTKQSGWAIVDKDGKVRAMLGLPAGQHILNLPGISARNPMNQNPPPDPRKQTMALPMAGMGSQQAQQQGLNQNLAGVPTVPLPQQPQQTAIG